MLAPTHDAIAETIEENLLQLIGGEQGTRTASVPLPHASTHDIVKTIVDDAMLLKGLHDSTSPANNITAIQKIQPRALHTPLLIKAAETLFEMRLPDDAAKTLAPLKDYLHTLTTRQSLAWCQLQYALGNYCEAIAQLNKHHHEATEPIHILKARLLVGLGRLKEAQVLIKCSPYLQSSPAPTFRLIDLLIATLSGQAPVPAEIQLAISGQTLTAGNEEILLLLFAELRMADQAFDLMNQMPDTPFLRVNRVHVLHLASRPIEAERARESVLKDIMALNEETGTGTSQLDNLSRYIVSGYTNRIPPSHPWFQLASLRCINPESRAVPNSWWIIDPATKADKNEN